MKESETSWPDGGRPAHAIVTARIAPLPDLDRLEAEWRDLEARSEGSFFLSWHWIGCWLACISQHFAAQLLRVEREGRVVGLAVLIRRTAWRHGFVSSRGLHLNCTGDSRFDEINVEYNGILAEKGTERQVFEAGLRLLTAEDLSWDELHLPGLGPDDIDLVRNVAGTSLQIRNEGPCRYVDLEKLRATRRTHLDALGRSTRYNARRSQREYAMLGEVVLDEAHSLDEAVEFLDRLRIHHQRYWVARGEPGSFSNMFFANFHDRLVRTAFASGVIQILRVRAGSHEIGYLYNFAYRRHVYNYQSGFDYGDAGNPHRRPGMVAHALAIAHNATLGARAYDFLAGDSDFKRNFSTDSMPMAWCVVQRSRAMFRVEDRLRRIRNLLLGNLRGFTKAAKPGVNP